MSHSVLNTPEFSAAEAASCVYAVIDPPASGFFDKLGVRSRQELAAALMRPSR